MGAHNSTQSQTSFFALKAKTSDSDPTAFFGKNSKVGGQWTITERFNSFNGNLIDIKHSTYEYEGQTKYKCELIMKDNDGTQNILSANYSNLLYSLLNSLASCEPEYIEMNLSLGKAKVIDGKEGKRFPSIWLKNNGEEIKWKYEVADQPKADKVKVGGKIVSDDTKVIDFWTEVIDNEIKPKLKGQIKELQIQKSHVPVASDSDLPF